MVCPKPEVTPETVLPRPEVVFWAAEPMGPPSWVFLKKKRGLVSEGGREWNGVGWTIPKKRRAGASTTGRRGGGGGGGEGRGELGL